MDTQELLAPRLLALGDAAWTVEFGREISAVVNARVMDLAERIALLRQDDPLFAAVSDVVPTFRSLTLHFDPLLTDAEALGKRLLRWLRNQAANCTRAGAGGCRSASRATSRPTCRDWRKPRG